MTMLWQIKIMTFLTILGVTEILCSFKWPTFVDSSALLAYASLAGLRTLLQRLLVCLNFPLESEHLSFWYNRKKWFLWTMATAQAAENHEDEWDLSWYFLWRIYASLATWTDPHNSLTAAEATSLKISCHETSLKWSQRPSQSALEYI